MKSSLSIILIALSLSVAAHAQRSNDAIQKQIKTLKAEKQITLTFEGNTSKVMVISDNFADSEAKTAGIQAMNFGVAFFYPGQTLTVSPEEFNFAFWVLTKKPQFANGSRLVVKLPDGDLDLGDSRYAGKPGENMEYLNFKIKREDMKKIAAGSKVKFSLGQREFTFTASQLTALSNLMAVSDSK